MRILLALVLTSGVAVADKNLERGTTWDCKKDPVVHIGNGDGSYKFKGACKTISVGGGENRLTIESVDMLEVAGAENKISVGTVGTIDVGGADNVIKWKKATTGDKPALRGQPEANTITQVK